MANASAQAESPTDIIGKAFGMVQLCGRGAVNIDVATPMLSGIDQDKALTAVEAAKWAFINTTPLSTTRQWYCDKASSDFGKSGSVVPDLYIR